MCGFWQRRFSGDYFTFKTEIILQRNAAGKTAVGPLVVFDGVSDARVGLTIVVAVSKLTIDKKNIVASMTGTYEVSGKPQGTSVIGIQTTLKSAKCKNIQYSSSTARLHPHHGAV